MPIAGKAGIASEPVFASVVSFVSVIFLFGAGDGTQGILLGKH